MRFAKVLLIICLFLSFFLIRCEKEKEIEKGTNQTARDPRYDLKLPHEGSWVIYRSAQYSDGFTSAWRSIFILQGSIWRLELEKHRGPVTVAVYDGRKLFMSRKSKLGPENLNPLLFYRQVYTDIQRQFVFNTEEDVNGYACWQFIGSGSQGTNAMLWVESKGNMIRKAFTHLSSGESITEEFFDLPAEIMKPNNLFDPKNLSPVLLTQLKSWRIK
jgi:hypothetical protein